MEQKVKIANEVFLYRDKAPYVRSGFGEQGVLRLTADLQQVMCHECGEYMKSVSGPHLRKWHNMTAREYKLKHGLPLYAALISEPLRARLTESTQRRYALGQIAVLGKRSDNLRKGTAKARASCRKTRYAQININGLCRAQIVQHLQEITRRLGRTPTGPEFAERSGVSLSAVAYRFGGYPSLCLEAGIEHVRKYGKPLYTKPKLLRFLRNFYSRNHRSPSASDWNRGMLPGMYVFKRAFGTLINAFVEAEIPVTKHMKKRAA